MNLLTSCITYFRRIIKTQSASQITDELIIDYINRFWTQDVDARIQLFDLKTKYQFLTTPGVDQYNMPLYGIQTEPGSQQISYYPVYQGFLEPCFVNGIQIPYYNQRSQFNNIWPNYVQLNVEVGIGNGTTGPYTLSFPFLPGNSPPNNNPVSACIIRGHVDMIGVIEFNQPNTVVEDPPVSDTAGSKISTVPVSSVYSAVYFTAVGADGTNITVADSGQFLTGNQNYGILMQPGTYPDGNLPLVNGPTPNYSTTQNTINYFTGIAQNVYFPTAIPDGSPINGLCYYYQMGIPRSVMFYNNCLTFRAPPDTQYLVELDAYLSPAAFLSSSSAIPLAYMTEYIALGSARKLLYETKDEEQLRFYEPIFREQEALVWKRSQREFTSTRTPTIYSSSGFGTSGWGIGNNAGLT